MEIFQDDKKVYTLIWKIRNFSFGCHPTSISSPIFKLQANEISSWRLGIALVNEKKWISYCLGPMHSVSSAVGFEIDCLDQNGSPWISTKVPTADFSSKFQYNGAFAVKSPSFLSRDTLSFRFKMWEVEGSSLVTEQVFAQTELEVKRGKSFWCVKKFSNLKYGGTKAMLLQNSSKDIMPISFSIFKEMGGYLRIKVTKLDSKTIKHCECNFFLLDSVDAAGGKEECGKLEFTTVGKEIKPEWEFPLKETLRDKTRFLLNDILSFQCDYAFSTGVTSEKIVQSKFAGGSNLTGKNSEKLNTLKADLKSLYNEPILFDTKLHTTTESFHVHSVILSARSPVFRAMFTTDMKEKSKECVYIEDLDANTMRRMLLFLYSDIVEDLDWESAKRLYIASDKYDIVNLRHLCASFLKKNILPSNCCDALLLAHMHQDSELMSSVQDFMSEHTKEILNSEEWKNLEKQDILLTSETLRLLLLKSLPK